MAVKNRLHRSELAVPGSNRRMLEKAPDSGADIVFLDLEDAVAPDDKDQARINILEATKRGSALARRLQLFGRRADPMVETFDLVGLVDEVEGA